MSRGEFRACLDTIGWSQRSLARRLGIHHTRTERMGTGRYPVLPEGADWLYLVAAFHVRNNLPNGWREYRGADHQRRPVARIGLARALDDLSVGEAGEPEGEGEPAVPGTLCQVTAKGGRETQAGGAWSAGGEEAEQGREPRGQFHR